MTKMVCRILQVFLCFILILGTLPVFGWALGEVKPQTRGSYPIPAFGAQALWDKHERGIPLVVAHKGDWRNFPENSLLGINSCINMGVDIVEVDFHVTKDGVPVLLHDTNLRRMTDADTLIYIADITWAQAKKYSLEDGQGNKGTNYVLSSADAKVLNSIPTYVSTVGTAKAGGTMPIARFDSVLELVNKRAFLLMDKVTDADTFAYAYVCAREWDMTDYVIFKNNYTVDVMETWYAAGAKLWNQKHGNQAITAQEVKESTLYEFNSTNLTNMQAHMDSGVNLAFCSTGITADNVARIRDTVVPFCKKNGIVIRANTGEGLGDTAKTDSEVGWAEILKVGVTEIMTDHPGELLSYLQQVYSTRAASDRIEAEHFTDYNLTNFGFQVPLEYNSGKNKFVTNLTSKDTLIYENIEFDGTENILTAKAMGSNAKITVYIDGTAAEDKVGTLSYNSTSYASAQVKIAPVPAGKHTVYLKFSGTVGLDQFRFTRGLYFAFSNETLARFRYQDRLYGSTNYDTGNWLARTATMGAASLDNTAGTLSATLTAGGNHYIQTGTAATARPLHYIPGKNDYFQLRLKITDATANDPASKIYAGLVFSGTGCGDFDYNEKVVTELTASQLNGKYFTLTLPLNSAFTAATEITALRMYFMNLASISGKTGKITVDHLYIGPKEHLPQQDYLYFGFTDRDTDEMRYQTEAYGYQNFDSRTWIARTSTMRGAWFDRQNSTLLARVTTGGNHYMQSGTSVSERPLRYAPKVNDYLQMVLQIRDGKLHNPSLPLSVGISYCGKNDTEFVYDEALLNDFTASVIDSGFFTVTLPLPSSFTAESEIQSLRIYIRNLAPKEKEALIEVDSLYIGPKSSLPKPLYTVTFLNGDGSILSTQEVAKGDPASYAGKTPTKAPDIDKHYSFSAWDKSLKNITANTTFTPQFTAAQHSFTYSKADRNTHKASCPCGYIGSESHSNTETVTPPTCTAQGYTTYTCSRCHESYKDSYVNAKGHTEVTDKAVAATCTTTGKTEGKHCSVCNVVLVAQQTIPATGHTEVIDKAVAATCTTAGKTEGKHCSVCNVILIAQQSIPATGHSDTAPADNRCDICGARIKEAVLRFRTISLKGNIAINYYMDLSDEVAADENAYMLFTMENGEQIKVPASEGEYSLYQKAYYYSFTCAVSAKEMTDTVLCQFFWSGGQTEVYTYSVKTYADRILASSTSAKLRDLIFAMLNYGAASQIHFEYHTERLANAGQEVPDYSQITIDGYSVNTKQGTTLATYAGASLLLTSETTLRIFFTVDSSIADQFTVSYKGQGLPLGIRSGKYYADIPDIGAKDLDEYFTLTISDGRETAEVSYSPLSYCASIIENAKGIHDRQLQDVAAAMYLYNQAANTYFAP